MLIGTESQPITPVKRGDASFATTRQRLSIVTSPHRHAAIHEPSALDLESLVLDTLSENLSGVSTHFRGGYTDKGWLDTLAGFRGFSLLSLCRLTVSRRTEGKRAALEAVRVLARALGFRLVPLKGVSLKDATVGRIHEVVGDDPYFQERDE